MDLLQAFTNLISDVYDAIISAGSAVMQFAEQLGAFDKQILVLNEAARRGEVAGLPVNGAIATWRYLVGDTVFNLFYFMILFGCMFTIYQLIFLIYSAYRTVKDDSASGASTGAGWLGKLAKHIKFK